MFDQMRRNTKTILWITVVAFVGLIFLAWGAEFQLGGKKKVIPGSIGTVNGEPVYSQPFEQAVVQARATYQQQSGKEVDDRTETMIRNQTWNDLVRETLMRQEAVRRRIRVSDEEVVNAIMNQPPQDVVQNPGFQTDGRFDLGKYQAALRDPNVDTRALEAQFRTSLPLQKLQMQILGAVSISDAEMWNAFEAQTEKIKVSFVMLPASKFEVDAAGIDRSVLEQYYQSHKKSYKTPPQAVVQFVSIPRRYTEQDSLNLIDQAKQVIQEFKDGEDFSVLVEAYSEAAQAMRGGANATWMTAEQISDPVVRTAAFSLQAGAISDVLIAPDGVHVIRVDDRKTDETGDQVKVSDIFMPLKASPETLSQLRDEAVQFRNEATQRDFAQVAGEMKLQVRETPAFGEEGFIPGLGSATEVQDFAFRQSVGSVSPPIEKPEGWMVVRVKERHDTRIPDLNEIQERVRQEAADSLRLAQAMPIAERLLQQAQSGTPLASLPASDSRVVFETTDPFPRLGYPKGIGNDPGVIGPLFASTGTGLVGKVLKGRNGLFIASVDERTPADKDQFEAQKAQLRQTLVQRRQTRLFNDWYNSLRKTAEIDDYRFGDFAS